MAALIITVVQFVKYLQAKDTRSALTQLTGWAIGVGVAFLYAQSTFASGIIIGDRALDSLTSWDLTVFGLNLGAVGGVIYSAVVKPKADPDPGTTPSE